MSVASLARKWVGGETIKPVEPRIVHSCSDNIWGHMIEFDGAENVGRDKAVKLSMGTEYRVWGFMNVKDGDSFTCPLSGGGLAVFTLKGVRRGRGREQFFAVAKLVRMDA